MSFCESNSRRSPVYCRALVFLPSYTYTIYTYTIYTYTIYIYTYTIYTYMSARHENVCQTCKLISRRHFYPRSMRILVRLQYSVTYSGYVSETNPVTCNYICFPHHTIYGIYSNITISGPRTYFGIICFKNKNA